MTNPSTRVLDAEIVDMTKSTEIEVARRPIDIVGRIRPAVDTVAEHGPGWAWSIARFALVAISLDLLRGVRTWWLVWWRWKTLATSTEKAEREGKFSVGEDKRQERREKRTVMSFGGGFILIVTGLLFYWLAPPEWWTYVRWAGLATLVALFASGHQWRRPPEQRDDDARQPGYDGSIESVRDGLREAGVLKKPTKTVKGQNVWYVKPPERVGAGTQLYLRLDKGVSWAKILDNLSQVGSALDFNSTFAVVEQIGNDSDAALWMPDGDPFAAGPVPCPLIDEDQWDAWESAPFALTPHGVNLDMSLIGSNALLGGRPGAGKSFSARPMLAPYVLDPEVRIFVANGKGDPAWEALKDISVKYIRGAEDDQVWEFLEIIEMLIEEMKRRYAAITESKVTKGAGFAPWLFAIDEVQEYLGSTVATDLEARGKKKARLGLVIDDRLTTLARLARAAGLVIVMLTQRPDDTVMSLALRSMFGTRFANKVTTDHNSKMILGQSGPGKDASKLPTKYKGLGILVPDGETVSIEGTPMCRPYFVSDEDWRALGKKGYDLRRRAGTAGYLRLSEQDARPLPELLQDIADHVADFGDGERVASAELREKYAPELNATAFGRQLRKWGCPSGRDNGKQAMGPRVSDIRAVAQRIREGGSVEVLKSA